MKDVAPPLPADHVDKATEHVRTDARKTARRDCKDAARLLHDTDLTREDALKESPLTNRTDSGNMLRLAVESALHALSKADLMNPWTDTEHEQTGDLAVELVHTYIKTYNSFVPVRVRVDVDHTEIKAVVGARIDAP